MQKAPCLFLQNTLEQTHFTNQNMKDKKLPATAKFPPFVKTKVTTRSGLYRCKYKGLLMQLLNRTLKHLHMHHQHDQKPDMVRCWTMRNEGTRSMAFVPWAMQCFIIFDLTEFSFSSVSCVYKQNIINNILAFEFK